MTNPHTQLQMTRRRIFPESGMPSPGEFAALAGVAAFAACLGGVATALGTTAFAGVAEGAPSAFAMLEAPLVTV